MGDDLIAACRAARQWRANEPVDVGESGTLYRFLRFAAWKMNQDRKFIRRGTLKNRNICDNPDIVNWPLKGLLALDNGTSQWASAALLAGSEDPRPPSVPHKMQVTYDAIKHWEEAQAKGNRWLPRVDQTIAMQAAAYTNAWDGSRPRPAQIDFTPAHAEDYCFARAFGLISPGEGENRWPSLRGHESDRIAEMEKALREERPSSRDHRVIQAVAMRRGLSRKDVAHPDCVSKSWPRFWKFLEEVRVRLLSRWNPRGTPT
jgi:hypothetical protein